MDRWIRCDESKDGRDDGDLRVLLLEGSELVGKGVQRMRPPSSLGSGLVGRWLRRRIWARGTRSS
jgi:hypothetical protein